MSWPDVVDDWALAFMVVGVAWAAAWGFRGVWGSAGDETEEDE